MPKLESDDTIAAIATPIGEGGISVIRVSGPGAFEMVRPFFRSSEAKELDAFPPNTIHWGKFLDLAGCPVDQVLVSIFRTPHSYTGQDVLEISCHGGLAVTKRILNLLLEKGARHAEPGEFTRRAFLNGKLDLTQAEAVLDLIHAKSTRALDIAARQLSGSLSRTFQGLKESLLKILAHTEACIDFPEESLDAAASDAMQEQLAVIQTKIRALVSGFDRNQRAREGVLVTIAGKPNVGKSSLFNALLERDRALVSDLPHTTRDHLEEPLEIRGFYIRLRDTAGLVAGPGHPLDRLGMDRTLQALRESQVVLYVVEGSAPLEDSDRHVFEKIPQKKNVIVLMNKSDLPMNIGEEDLRQLTRSHDWIRISARTREGFKELEQRIAALLEQETSEDGEQITRLRHRVALEVSLEALKRAEAVLRAQGSFEILSLELRSVLDALKELTGEVYSEDVLDVIFSEFCIGK
ncbi:MAG TPA: tRNA uridine-5-carboxymethylaminomethyl(34) synthesis GTPase MnmE [Candidatus Omnitrophota bacterium]|nr:tRNA uridine-5-carboxymethylaminomethyl(34) synthesis GTPase MnmE [Candidatus Omnitrophota bacterium]HPS36227.1 tRNA uridine-5-carboxymethylaminomethyl(34) synthesis GTPase MnmE [Candidatus Omnitrophota bacterium]